MKTDIKQRWSELIEKTGKNKMEIAALAGVNKSNITNYCSGRYKAKQETIFNVCRPLGINPSWLMGFDVPMTLPVVPEPAPGNQLNEEAFLNYVSQLSRSETLELAQKLISLAAKEE